MAEKLRIRRVLKWAGLLYCSTFLLLVPFYFHRTLVFWVLAVGTGLAWLADTAWWLDESKVLSKRQRIWKWAGLSACLLMFGTILASGGWRFTFFGSNWHVRFQHGMIWYDSYRGPTSEINRELQMWKNTYASGPGERSGFLALVSLIPGDIVSWGGAKNEKGLGCRVTRFPLGTVLFFVAVPTFVLWRHSLRRLFRRRLPEGHCVVCRYNLAYNTSGICPECGTPISDVPTLADQSTASIIARN